jgi:very-short-patch-repair endonuclease
MRQRFDRIRAVLPSEAAAAHLTAARIYGMWLPQLPDWLPVQASLPPDCDRPERRGLYVFRSRARLPPCNRILGTPVLPPAHVVGQLAEDLGLVDLVVALDSALHQRLCTTIEIFESMRRRQRGLPLLRTALTLCDARSESAWETILRLLHVLSGIPVEPQFLVKDPSGSIVARADLRIVGTRRLPEYDGAAHRERRQHEDDLARDKLLSRLRYERFGYIASEIIHQPETILRDAERALAIPHDPGRLNAWRTATESSSLTAMGRRRLLHRLHRFARPLRGRST